VLCGVTGSAGAAQRGAAVSRHRRRDGGSSRCCCSPRHVVACGADPNGDAAASALQAIGFVRGWILQEFGQCVQFIGIGTAAALLVCAVVALSDLATGACT
jgi:hypothetical protein